MIERDGASTQIGNAQNSLAQSDNSKVALVPPSLPSVSSPSMSAQGRWQARHALCMHRAETERLRVLVDFLSRPIHTHAGIELDADVVTAYNLAVEASLKAIRRCAVND